MYLPEADVVKRLVVNDVGHVCVLYQLMYGQGGVVRFYYNIRDLFIGIQHVRT